MRTRKKTRRTRGQWSTDNACGGGHDPDIGLGGDLDDAHGNGCGGGGGLDDADGGGSGHGNDRDDAVGDDHVDGNDRDHDIDVFRSVLTPQPRAACSRSARVARRLDWKGNP